MWFVSFNLHSSTFSHKNDQTHQSHLGPPSSACRAPLEKFPCCENSLENKLSINQKSCSLSNVTVKTGYTVPLGFSSPLRYFSLQGKRKVRGTFHIVI